MIEFTEEYRRDRDYQYKKLEEIPEQLVAAMFNQLYRFHASNPSFNSYDGTSKIDIPQETVPCRTKRIDNS